jgi:hypothetical protein
VGEPHYPRAMERMWSSRLRWRLRGAWQWPTFLALTVVDGLLLHARPVQGLSLDLVPGLLLAGFANLILVAVAAPAVGLLVRRRRRDLPRLIASDYAGTVLIAALTGGILVTGIVHHGDIVRERRAADRAIALARDFAAQAAPPVARKNLPAADTLRIDPGRVYRTCLPMGTDRSWCVVVHVDQEPPRIVFAGHEPNALLGAGAGP